MTNKEKYKQAFSVLHSPGEMATEGENMINRKKSRSFRGAAAAALYMRRTSEASSERSRYGLKETGRMQRLSIIQTELTVCHI